MAKINTCSWSRCGSRRPCFLSATCPLQSFTTYLPCPSLTRCRQLLQAFVQGRMAQVIPGFSPDLCAVWFVIFVLLDVMTMWWLMWWQCDVRVILDSWSFLQAAPFFQFHRGMDTFLPELNDFIQSGTGLTDSWIMDDKFGARGGVIQHGWKMDHKNQWFSYQNCSKLTFCWGFSS